MSATLIIGGYGVVGKSISKLLIQFHPEIPLIIAGRSLEKAEEFAQELNEGEGIDDLLPECIAPKAANGKKPNQVKAARVVLGQPLDDALVPKVNAIILCVHDGTNHMIAQAAKLGIPLVELSHARLDKLEGPVNAPIMFGGAWMTGLGGFVAIDECEKNFASVSEIDIAAYFRKGDLGGPDSADIVSTWVEPFTWFHDGKKQQVYSFTHPKLMTFPDIPKPAKAYLTHSLEVETLPELLHVSKSFSFRLASDDPFFGYLDFLRRCGVLSALNRPYMKWLRVLLLPTGEGHTIRHDMVVRITGTSSGGDAVTKEIKLMHPTGHVDMTACGLLISYERLMHLDGGPALAPGVCHCFTQVQTQHALKRMRECGVVFL